MVAAAGHGGGSSGVRPGVQKQGPLCADGRLAAGREATHATSTHAHAQHNARAERKHCTNSIECTALPQTCSPYHTPIIPEHDKNKPA